jgi:hypothetical protein
MPWRTFYTLKPLVPRPVQLWLRRQIVRKRRKSFRHVWPIDPSAATPPHGWPGWPESKRFAFVLIHDVDTQKGHDACHRLAAIEHSLGFRSAFNFVPERYHNSKRLQEWLRSDGFEIGVHGLNHDGKLFQSFSIFENRAKRINRYLAQWKANGFTSPSMHHNLDWMHLLNITHSTSTFDTDPFEPQPDAAGTIFPFIVSDCQSGHRFLELPYTLPQDFTLFILMREKTNSIWKQKLDWIATHGGMALLNTHADYMNFGDTLEEPEEYPVSHYIDFLEYIRSHYQGQYFHAKPGELTHLISPLLQPRKTSSQNLEVHLN